MLLQAGYAATVELVTVEELQAQAAEECAAMWKDYPSNRIRFKHIGGGGGKGQRVVASPEEIDAAAVGNRSMSYARIDQLAIEHMLGAR